MSKNRIRLLLLCVIALVSSAEVALALRCGDQLVAIGDGKVGVLAKCGEPMLKDQREESVEEFQGPSKRRVTTSIDEWTFNFGPKEFLHFLRFENGRLVEIRTGGYGGTMAPNRERCRNGQLLSVGDSSAEVLFKCGEPALKERRADKIIESATTDTKRRENIVIDDWTYNFGTDHFLYFLNFENGRVKEIRTGGYGY